MAQLELPSAARVAEVLAVLGPGGRIRSVGELERALGDVCVRGGLQLAGLRGVLAGMPAALQATFWARVLPSLCARLGALRALFPEPIPLLVQGRAAAVSLSKAQAAALLSAMFLLCLPEQGASTGEPWPAVSMRRLLSSAAPQEMAKLRALLHYFGRALGGEGGGDGDETGTLTFRRLVLPPLAPDAWAASRAPMSSLRVLGQGHAIEEAAGCLQADFANAYLGGGVLSGGCVQEEIRFAIAPELTACVALCPVMYEHEAIAVREPNYLNFMPAAILVADPVRASQPDRRRAHLLAVPGLRLGLAVRRRPPGGRGLGVGARGHIDDRRDRRYGLPQQRHAAGGAVCAANGRAGGAEGLRRFFVLRGRRPADRRRHGQLGLRRLPRCASGCVSMYRS